MQFSNRKPLFKCKNNDGDFDISHQPRADDVMQPDRKRSRTIYSVSSNLQKEDCDDVKQTKSLVAESIDHSAYRIISVKTQDGIKQHGEQSSMDLSGMDVECHLIESADKVKSAESLNVRWKKSNKQTLSPDNHKNISSRDILDDETFCLSTVENDVCAGKINDNHTVDSNTSSQDSFADLFASSTASMPVSTQQSNSELFSSQNTSSLKDNNDSILDFLDVNDSKLAELDVSGLISSYNSPCKDSENQKEKHVKLRDESIETSQQGSIDYKNIATNRYINPLEKLNTCANFMNGINYECVSGDESEKLFHGLSLNVESLIKKHKGIKNLYDWQNDCLNLPGVKNQRNLIYSLPTSGGKTLVAEILIMKELICHKKDALLVLPFVSIVQEKVRDMSLFAVDLEFLVEEYAASKGKFPPRKRRKKKSLYIATIEKANGLVNCLIEENRLSEIGLVVVDELHMLGEGGHRGATLEMCLAKILYCSSSTQIIGMSATLNNIADLQKFLNAEVYVNDFRPVELREFFKIGNEIYEVKNDRIGRNEDVPFKCSRRIEHQTADKKVLTMDPDHLSVLVEEVIPNYSCLFFCPTKKSCENVAQLLAKTLPRELKKIKVPEKLGLLRSLKSNADGLCPVLQRVIPYGIAYHHGGLTMDERKLIEEAYSQGTLCLLTCTSTLAAGVNLPAKRVILRSPYVGKNVMSRSQYKQMIGRAGRAGIDTSGESIMLLEKKDKDKAMNLINAPLESCHSSLLHSNGQGLRSLVLSLIGLKICNSIDDINLLISKTLLAVQNDSQGNNTLLQTVYENISTLVELKLVKRWKSTVEGKPTMRVETTPLGTATFKGCVDVDRSPFIYEEVKRAQENLVLTNDLHLLYLVTTPDMSADIQPSWMTYLEQVSNLNSVEQKAGEFIGVSEGYISRKVSGHVSEKNEQQLSVVKRFYLTLMLYKIINEHSIWDVANTFDIPRGFVQSLFSSSTSFASCLVHFTNELPEFHNIKLLLETIVDKLSYTAVLELVPLMQIPGVKKNRARQLHTSGYRNLQAVAKADPDTLMQQIEYLPKTQAKLLVSAAKMLLLEKAEALQEEAAELIGT